MKKLEGKVAIITGGTMGMGFGSAMALAKEGATVVLIGRSDAGHEAVKKIEQAGGKASFYSLDVRDFEKMQSIYDEVVEKYGKLDILINSAGLGMQKAFLKADREWIDTYMGVNFYGIWNSCKAAIPHMLRNGYGKIVNYSSVTGVMVADPCMTAYAATKGAIMSFTKALASEFARNNITVNAILPGLIYTPMAEKAFLESCPEDPDSVKAAMEEQIPMGRMGTIEEAGKVALFLASDDSSYITGIGLVFDGGSTIPEAPGTGWQPVEI